MGENLDPPKHRNNPASWNKNSSFSVSSVWQILLLVTPLTLKHLCKQQLYYASLQMSRKYYGDTEAWQYKSSVVNTNLKNARGCKLTSSFFFKCCLKYYKNMRISVSGVVKVLVCQYSFSVFSSEICTQIILKSTNIKKKMLYYK